MPGQIRITFRNFTGLDFSGAIKVPLAKAKTNVIGEETILRGAIDGLGALSNTGQRLRGEKALIAAPSPVMTIVGSIPKVRIRSPSPDFTIADGVTASAGAVAAVGSGGGIYFWNKRPDGEVGLYGSISAGLISNLGVSAGVQIAFMFGKAPDVLGGDSIALSVDIGIDIATVTGSLILNAPPGGVWPPSPTMFAGWIPEVIGIAFGLSVGVSALPVDYSVMPGRTWLKPIT
jgi:hypothetical protein